jgi:prolyl oligopeptidase
VLLIHGVNDPRVDVWHSSKMAARLLAANTSDKPVLLDLDYESGHGIGNTKAQRQKQIADYYAFMLWQAGDRDLQPAQ